MHVASRREPEPGTRSRAPARAAGAPPTRPRPLPPRPATVAPGCRQRGGRGEVPPPVPPPPRPQPLPAVSPHLSGRGPGGHLVSLGAARGSSDPKLRAAGPPARSSSHRPHKHLPGTSGVGAGAAGKARPTGRGFKWDKSPGSVRPARASPRGTPGRRLGLRRPRPARRSAAPGPSAVPSALGRLFRSLLPHLTSPERAAAKRRAVGGQSRRGQLKQPRKTCRTGPLSMPGRRGRGLGGGGARPGPTPARKEKLCSPSNLLGGFRCRASHPVCFLSKIRQNSPPRTPNPCVPKLFDSLRRPVYSRLSQPPRVSPHAGVWQERRAWPIPDCDFLNLASNNGHNCHHVSGHCYPIEERRVFV